MGNRQEKSIIGRDADAAPREGPATDIRNAATPAPAAGLDPDCDEGCDFDIVFEVEAHPYGTH